MKPRLGPELPGKTACSPREVASQDGPLQRRVCKYLAALVLFAATSASAGCGAGSSTPASSQRAVPAKSASKQTVPAKPARRPAVPAASSSQRAAVNDAHATPDLIASADAICARINNEFQAERPDNAGMAEVGRVASRRAVAEATILTELHKLTPTPSLASGWQQILAYWQSRVENLRALAKYAESDDVPGVSSVVAAGESLKRKLLALASSKRFTSCSEVG